MQYVHQLETTDLSKVKIPGTQNNKQKQKTNKLKCKSVFSEKSFLKKCTFSKLKYAKISQHDSRICPHY